MRRHAITVEIEASDNATPEEVRGAVERCLTYALHIYAWAGTTRPHRLTGGPEHGFGYAVIAVRLPEEQPR